jgi:hypothetical protein
MVVGPTLFSCLTAQLERPRACWSLALQIAKSWGRASTGVVLARDIFMRLSRGFHGDVTLSTAGVRNVRLWPLSVP